MAWLQYDGPKYESIILKGSLIHINVINHHQSNKKNAHHSSPIKQEKC